MTTVRTAGRVGTARMGGQGRSGGRSRRYFVASSLVLLTGVLALGVGAQERAAGANPVAYSPASVARGKTYFLQNCQSCHDEDGRARSAAVAIAADLTAPERWKFGSGDAELFKTIKNGAAEAMPPFGADLKDDQIWDVVNFIRSIGPESKRPK